MRRFGYDTPSAEIRTEFERDWDRIIFSSPFRRLQNKTQVFPLPEEIFVHNRLTHSLEVASVGRSLGKMVGEKLINLKEIQLEKKAAIFYKEDLKHVIASACLAHDLGNPAFGHSGEEAISKYFKNRETGNPADIAFKAQFTKQEWHDLTNFEGNANALRILTLQQNGRLKGGFRLTYSTLASIIKYPCESSASLGKKGPKHRNKYGYFKIDEETFLDIAKEMKMFRDESASEIVYKRHPFVYLVEAADDICYNIIDLEDAHRLNIMSFEEVSELLMQIIKQDEKDLQKVEKTVEELKSDTNEAVAYLRAKAINTLAVKCAEAFIQHKEEIIKGELDAALIDCIPGLQAALKEISDVSVKKIYNYREVVKIEIAGFRIMSGLVKDFVEAALTPVKSRSKEHHKILELLPKQFTFDESGSPYTKVMHMIDFIAGMTDIYALKLYRNLRGIEM